MKQSLNILSILVLFQLQVIAQKINVDKSVVSFEIGNLGFGSVNGTIKGIQGDVFFNMNALSTSYFNVFISPNTINTKNEKRDEHLKSQDFFNIEKYKTISFVSTSVYKTTNGYITKGKLTMLNTTKNIEIPFNVDEINGKTILKGTIEINRFDYGLAADSYKTSMLVGKTAKVEIKCVLD